jgi:hypothetical protein
MVRLTLILGVLVSAQLVASAGAANRDAGDTAGARTYVQEFYDWYVPRALQQADAPSWELVLGTKRFAFDPRLLDALKKDLAAGQRTSGDVDNLDFDPFLASQDPDEKYEVGNVSFKGGSYWAEIHGVSDRQKIEPASVVAEVRTINGRLTFLNFHYPAQKGVAQGDLLTILKQLAASRR